VASEDSRDDPAWPIDLAPNYVPSTKHQGIRSCEYVTWVPVPGHVSALVMNDWRELDEDVMLNNSDPPFVPMLCPYLPHDNFSDTVMKVRGRVADQLGPFSNALAVGEIALDLRGRTEPFAKAKLETLFYKDPHFAADVLCTMRNGANNLKRAREVEATSNFKRVRAELQVKDSIISISEDGLLYPQP
jgi:hypothetical protein